MSNTPVVATLGITNVEIGSKLREQRGENTLGEDVSKLQARRDVMDADVAVDVHE